MNRPEIKQNRIHWRVSHSQPVVEENRVSLANYPIDKAVLFWWDTGIPITVDKLVQTQLSQELYGPSIKVDAMGEQEDNIFFWSTVFGCAKCSWYLVRSCLYLRRRKEICINDPACGIGHKIHDIIVARKWLCPDKIKRCGIDRYSIIGASLLAVGRY